MAAVVTVVGTVTWSAAGPPAGDAEGTSVASAATGPPLSRALREDPPIGQVLTIPHPEFPGTPIRVWYSRSGEGGPLRFCSARPAKAADDVVTRCVLAEPMDAEEAGRIGDTTGTLPLPPEVITFGPAKATVGSVSATLDGGRATTLGARLEQGKDPLAVWAGPGMGVAGLWYGYTGADTARIEVRLADGRRASVRTVEGFPEQGVRLFGGELPENADPKKDGAVYVGFDAAGEEIWRHRVPSFEERRTRRSRTTPEGTPMS